MVALPRRCHFSPASSADKECFKAFNEAERIRKWEALNAARQAAAKK